jgi:aminoglycoside phosphotransferase family enzyme/predicted kinase
MATRARDGCLPLVGALGEDHPMTAREPLVRLDPAHGNAPGGAETHISVLLFAGPRAYKLCKPIDVGFLDYTTRERRAAALRTELAVNRRFAPDVYLGVIDLVADDGMVEDHALVMRRMPAERRLAHLLGGAGALDHVREVARAVATLHGAAPRPPAAAMAASRDAVARNWELNEAAMAPFVDAVLDAPTFAAVGRDHRSYLAGRSRLFEARIADGHAVDGHGDLLAEDIFCLDDGPRILDCLAFDERLRHGDVLLDVAFLAMDIERLADRALSTAFLASYDEFSGERHPASLAHHYIAYRSQVRAKIACLRHQQGAADAAAEAAGHLRRCADHLRLGRVRLVLVGGAPGTGKSTVAQALGDRRGWVVLRSDEVRKELSGLAARDDATAAVDAGIYRPGSTSATYAELRRRAGLLMELGETVVLDASWSDVAERDASRELAHRVSAEVVELRLDAPAEVAAARIEQRRAAHADASDATAEVAAAMRARFAPWPEATRLDTTEPVGRTVDAAARLAG